MNRARQLAKTHCPRGHPYSGDNLKVDKKTGARGCRICKIERTRKWRANLKEKTIG